MKTLLFSLLDPIAISMLIALVVAYFYLWYLILKDIITSNFNPPSPKFVWLFVVFVFGIFGGFIYVLIGKQTKYYE